MRIGIDVGGTNTDAVLMQGNHVLAKIKTPTTPDVMTGIVTALRFLIEREPAALDRMSAVMIGTTHFTNAIIERRRLQPTAVVRVALPATAALPPMVDWPTDLCAALGDHRFLVRGGHEYDGRPLAEVQADEIREVAREIMRRGIRSVAISAVFSTVNSAAEQQAAELIREVLPDAAISLSHEIGRMGLLERENAAILNACLQDLAATTIGAFRGALVEVGIRAPLYITQNDGTLMSAEYAASYPVLTFSSGPTNSMRGAAFLSGLKDAMVVDIGGTTTDVGALIQGFPREASVAVRVGGVRTNFRMPDVLSIGLGGGSIVRAKPLAIGPQSVGYELLQQALSFGGEVLTATDIAVAAGYFDLPTMDGARSKLAALNRKLVAAAVERIHVMTEDAIDRMKVVADDLPVVLVGGGSVLIDRPLKGVSQTIKPEHFEAANAVGAAIGQISGEVDRIFSLDTLSREAALAQAKAEAISRAVAAGAYANSVQIVDVEDVPLAYLPSNATRIRVKAAGDLAIVREGVSSCE
ncbi:MAG TPA: hydantoinase/oxoprolinase family protein [Herpetosiphonaceae bacterium]